MRAVWSVLFAVLAAGCASGGTNPGEPADGALVDGKEEAFADAAVDAPGLPPDAALDAPPPPDAAVLPPDACVPAPFEKLANPVFDLAPTGTGWIEVPIQGLTGGPYPIITSDGPVAHSAPNKAWLGGAAGEDATPAQASVTDQLYQDIVIPASTTQVVITGFYLVGTVDSTTTLFDTFRLDVLQPNGTPIETVLQLDNRTVAGAFTAFTKTLTANVAGQTIRLRATSTNDITLHTNFFLDTLSLKATHCP